MQQSFGADSITIVQGSSRDIKVLLKYPDGEAFDLTDITEAKALFPGKPLISITMADDEIEVLEPKSRGAMVLSLSAIKSKTLTVDQRLTFEIELKTATRTHIIQFKDSLDVERRLI